MFKYVIPYGFLALFIEDFMTHSRIYGRCHVRISDIREKLGRRMEGGLASHARVVRPGYEIDRHPGIRHGPSVVGICFLHHGHEGDHGIRREIEGAGPVVCECIADLGIGTCPCVPAFGGEPPVVHP